MMYCRICGSKLRPNTKYCQKCGSVVKSSDSASESQRMQFAGKVFKCPSCGQELKSFETNCPACGLEIRGVKANSSVRELLLKLEAIESQRENEKKPIFVSVRLSRTDARKISLIESFPIPTAKEDILEFMILAVANVDASAYDYHNPNRFSDIGITNAWLSKCDQAQLKAKSSMTSDDPCYMKIEDLYNSAHEKVDKPKRRDIACAIGMFLFMMGIIIVPYILWTMLMSDDQAEEERLTSLEHQIEVSIESKEYKVALLNAESMKYEGMDNEAKRKWGAKREYLIERIIEEAAKDGIELHRADESSQGTNTEINDTSISQESSAFIFGFKKGVTSDADAACLMYADNRNVKQQLLHILDLQQRVIALK